MKKNILLLLISLGLSGLVSAQTAPAIDPELEKELREMIRLTGADKMGLQMGEQMMQQISQASQTPIPREFIDRALVKFSGDGLIRLILPIYAKHLSLGDVREINAFYRTPAGQRILKAMPMMLTEAMQAGGAWGQGIAQEIITEMQTQGYMPKPM